MSIPEAFDPDAPAESDGLFGLPHTAESAAVIVVPVPFEATTSYRRGTKAGPDGVRVASWQVDLHDLETGEPWRAGIAMEEVDPRISTWNDEASGDALAVIEAGGLDPSDPELVAACARVNEIGERLNDLVDDRISALFARGRIPAVLGGDHAVPFGAMRAAARACPGLGVLHVDAHADLRAEYEGFTWSHASIFHNVATRIPGIAQIVQIGIRDVGSREMAFSDEQPNIVTWTDLEVAWELAGGATYRELAARMISPLPEQVWISWDIDGFEPSLCPSTGTPVPGGLSWREALVLLRVLGESGRRIVGFDLCETTPGPEGSIDAIVAARLLYKLAGWAIKTRGA